MIRLRFCPEKRGAAEVDLSGRSDSAVSNANGGVLQEDVAISPEERSKRDSSGETDSAVSFANGGVLGEDVAVSPEERKKRDSPGETRRSRRARSCRSVSARRPLPRISFAR